MRLFVGCSAVICLVFSIAPAWSQSMEDCTPKIGWIPLCSNKAKGTAVAEDVLAGKTFSNSNDVEIPGTMPNNGAVTITPGTSNQNIPAGYHNGSGTVIGDANLLPGYIKSGATIFGVSGTAIEASGTATPVQVLSGQSFSNASGPATGTMINVGAQSITPGISAQTITQGYHDGSGTVQGDTDLVSDNIKTGATIFGVTGTAIEASGTASPVQVLSGQSFSNASGPATGSMANVGGQSFTPGTSDQMVLQGYHDGTGKVAGDPALIPGNIKSGTAIFGVTGLSIEASGTASPDQVLSGQTFSNTSGPATGIMTDVGQQNFTPGTSDQIVLQGYHDGTGKVAGDLALIPGNIKSGATIFGVTGSYPDWPKQYEWYNLCNQGCYQQYTDPSIFLIGCQTGCNNFLIAIIQHL